MIYMAIKTTAFQKHSTTTNERKYGKIRGGVYDIAAAFKYHKNPYRFASDIAAISNAYAYNWQKKLCFNALTEVEFKNTGNVSNSNASKKAWELHMENLEQSLKKAKILLNEKRRHSRKNKI